MNTLIKEAFQIVAAIILFLICTLGVYADNQILMPVELTLGETITAFLPIDTSLTTVELIESVVAIYDATGSQSGVITTSTSEVVIQGDNHLFMNWTASLAGTAILSVSHPSWTVNVDSIARVQNPYDVRDATTYRLSASISRDATWSVAEPIIRSSSALYESVLEEALVNGQGEISKYHIVVYDQDTSISNYFQKGRHFWADDQSEVKAIFQRAVPDGDYSRYTYQQ